MLANLEEGGINRCLDKISFIVDLEQSRLLALDLAAEDEGSREGGSGRAERLAIGAVHLAQCSADQPGCLEQCRHIHHVDAIAFVGMGNAFIEKADDRLGNGEVSRRQQDYRSFTLLFENMHFPKTGNVVETRIGTGIGGKNNASVEAESYAVCHDQTLS